MEIKGITDPDAKAGVCLSLVLLWVALFKSARMEPRQRMYELGKKMTQAVFYQETLQLLWNSVQEQNQGQSLNETQLAKITSIVSADVSIKAEHLKSFKMYDPLCTHIEMTREYGIPHFLNILFAGPAAPKGSNHAIGLIPTPTKVIVFDPNLGEMHVPRGGNSLRRFGVDYWSHYLRETGCIDRQWSLFRMTGAGTAYTGS